jgi:hypothetical protein
MGLTHSIDIVFCKREPVDALLDVLQGVGWHPPPGRIRYKLEDAPDLEQFPFWSSHPRYADWREAPADDWALVRQELVSHANGGGISQVELQSEGERGTDALVSLSFWPPKGRSGNSVLVQPTP